MAKSKILLPTGANAGWTEDGKLLTEVKPGQTVGLEQQGAFVAPTPATAFHFQPPSPRRRRTSLQTHDDTELYEQTFTYYVFPWKSTYNHVHSSPINVFPGWEHPCRKISWVHDPDNVEFRGAFFTWAEYQAHLARVAAMPGVLAGEQVITSVYYGLPSEEMEEITEAVFEVQHDSGMAWGYFVVMSPRFPNMGNSSYTFMLTERLHTVTCYADVPDGEYPTFDICDAQIPIEEVYHVTGNDSYPSGRYIGVGTEGLPGKFWESPHGNNDWNLDGSGELHSFFLSVGSTADGSLSDSFVGSDFTLNLAIPSHDNFGYRIDGPQLSNIPPLILPGVDHPYGSPSRPTQVPYEQPRTYLTLCQYVWDTYSAYLECGYADKLWAYEHPDGDLPINVYWRTYAVIPPGTPSESTGNAAAYFFADGNAIAPDNTCYRERFFRFHYAFSSGIDARTEILSPHYRRESFPSGTSYHVESDSVFTTFRQIFAPGDSVILLNLPSAQGREYLGQYTIDSASANQVVLSPEFSLSLLGGDIMNVAKPDRVWIYTDSRHGLLEGGVTLSGFTGASAVLNGDWEAEAMDYQVFALLESESLSGIAWQAGARWTLHDTLQSYIDMQLYFLAADPLLAATNTTPIVATFSNDTSRQRRGTVTVSEAIGNTGANGEWPYLLVERQGDLPVLKLIGSSGNGVYLGRGRIPSTGGWNYTDVFFHLYSMSPFGAFFTQWL